MVKLYEGMTEGRGGNIPILPQIPLHSGWVGRGRRGRPDNARLHKYVTRTDVELTLPDSHAKCVGAWPLYDAKRGTTKTQ